MSTQTNTDRQKLKDSRLKLNLSQAALADLLGVSSQQVSNWERGRNPIPKMLWLALETIERQINETT